MGQAFRRASGRIRSASLDLPPSSSSSKKAVDNRPTAHPVEISGDNIGPAFEKELGSRGNSENFLEERDPQYDAMLSQLVGRIKSKPGSKLEMGEASVVEKYKRPLPKLRKTTMESSRYEERPAPSGTLNVAQLRHIMLLHQGKADDHDGPMDVQQIAEKFRIDIAQVQNILRFMSMPPENVKKQRNDE